MPIRSEKILFDSRNLSVVPDEPGVYGLYQSDQTIYYGESGKSIRDRIESLMGGHEGPCTQSARMMNWEVTAYSESREKQLLEEYKRFYGRLPRCNDRIG